MTARLLNPYRHVNSPVHNFPAGLKLLLAFIFVLSVVLLPRTAWLAHAGCAALLLALAALTRLPPSLLAGRLLMLVPLALGVAFLTLFQPGGPLIFAAMLLKSTLCLFCMVILSCATRFTDLIAVLWRIRAPPLLVTTIALMHRYIFLLFDESRRMQRARSSRAFAGGRFVEWKSSATVIAHLFVRCSERAERIFSAMCARGWRT
ncbi:MAG: hypothetical protein C0404_07745 [Verrucomicrobia bacterium]|nr:hypothetical protein [Verrucomicrobiota bacterium]